LYEGPWLGATVLHAPIWSEMEWPGDKKGDKDSKSVLLGYLRYGEKVPALAEPHKKANCPEGWYELVSGGFVCGKLVTLDMNHPRFRMAKAPDLDASLPYIYGANVANGTPLYRQIPSREERKVGEPWLFKPRKAKAEEDFTSASSASGSSLPDASLAAGFSEDPDAGVPWWEKDLSDGGPPPVTLEDLQESGGPISRRMVKGFFLSLDHDFVASGARWWKTVSGLSAPADRIFVAKPLTEFHGVWLSKDAASFATKNASPIRIDKLPVAFVLHGAKRWTLTDDRKHVSAAEGTPLDRFEAVGLTGEVALVAGVEYWETDQGFWLRSVDATRTEPGPPPEKLGEKEKWIDVNLHRQTLVAFEGTAPVFATIFSSGRNEHETSPGSFRIKAKHISATMDGDPDADLSSDGPYSIEDVPYIQYFNAGYALHGAFWHASFGSVKSHGCVNLAPWDARALFSWTEPSLPDGWHAVFSTKDAPGTRVIVHERAPGTCAGPSIKPIACP
jgi:lipoprotein-anchoring transpeptidase ErfK/SrfK